MPERKQSFALVMPTLNEVEGLRQILPRIDRSLFQEIYVVDGSSTDGTLEFCRENSVEIVMQKGSGLTAAYETAFEKVRSDAVVWFTPDGNSIPEALPALCAKYSEGYDMVLASRYLGDAKSEDDDFFTGIGNRMFTLMINVLFGGHYTDSLVGYRVQSRNAVERMRLREMSAENWLRRSFFRMNSWETGSSIRAARLKLKIGEIGVSEPKRIGGVRKMSIVKNGLGVLFQILHDFLFFRPCRDGK